jgi:hypothetical protein
MQSAVTAVQMAIRVLGVIQIVLGVLFWTATPSASSTCTY